MLLDVLLRRDSGVSPAAHQWERSQKVARKMQGNDSTCSRRYSKEGKAARFAKGNGLVMYGVFMYLFPHHQPPAIQDALIGV